MSHFSHFFRSSAQPFTLPSRWYAATCTYYAGAFFPDPLSFSCLWQGVETRFSVLSMQFHARHSRANNLLCYTSFVHMPEMFLAFRLCCGALCVTCSVVRVIEYFVLSAHLFSLKSCLCDGWGKYLCILYCHQGVSHMGEI